MMGARGERVDAVQLAVLEEVRGQILSARVRLNDLRVPVLLEPNVHLSDDGLSLHSLQRSEEDVAAVLVNGQEVISVVVVKNVRADVVHGFIGCERGNVSLGR